MSDLYEHDFCAWATEQAGLLRAGKLSEANIANIAEQIESMGRSEKRELVNRHTCASRTSRLVSGRGTQPVAASIIHKDMPMYRS
jgi:hypothetical protein